MALKTALQKVDSSMAAIATNALGSGVVLKVVSLFVSNVLSGSDASVDIEVNRDGTGYSVLKGGTIPAGKTLSVFLNKQIGVYLEEGDSLRLKASSTNSLEAVCSYVEADPSSNCEPLFME